MRPYRRSDGRARAFTLLEILGVLALIGLVGGLVVANLDALPAAFRQGSPESNLRRAFACARRLALDTHAPVGLRADGDTLTVTGGDGTPAATIAILPKDSGKRLSLLADDGSREQEAPALAEVTFTPEGSCSPVRIRIATTADRTSRLWRADTFSAILTEEAL